METIPRVLVCIDFSTYSEQTMAKAMAFVPKTAKIYLLNVINSRVISSIRSVSQYYSDDSVVDQYVEGNTEIRKINLKKIVTELSSEKPERFRLMVRVGVPFEEILDTVANERIGFSVLETHLDY